MTPGQPDKDKTLFGKAKVVYDYKELFSLPQGQTVLRHLIKTYHVLKPSFVPGDPNGTAYQEGQRSVVLSIMRWAGKDWTTVIEEIERQHNDARSSDLPPPP